MPLQFAIDGRDTLDLTFVIVRSCQRAVPSREHQDRKTRLEGDFGKSCANISQFQDLHADSFSKGTNFMPTPPGDIARKHLCHGLGVGGLSYEKDVSLIGRGASIGGRVDG
uniref:Uncharacterized protein n=1 Tax=Kwoniella dejecticola CBS 10117 TaxID=1296121 RepID=A0A1A6A4J0_9TREE|nr:uncharacterized protein I303_04303 [Kwoniella dejecticola CBS 10117]OBR84977.1 hypothetical protein I303_04303 [Kwoniella dejecticola CBS 10117]